ncbi:MAG: hypothetical protein NTW17_00445 [Candidatus Pacearchaeota archaeon]|nr:hypothetical protein [Candidatus Pacearchaeota archaeon]
MARRETALKKFKRKAKPKLKKFVNILLGLILFVLLIGSAFSISLIFGAAFIIGFALSIYNGDLKRKPLKPIFIFIGALLVRIALNQFWDPVLTSKTLLDLSVSALIFLSIIIFGWKIKRS